MNDKITQEELLRLLQEGINSGEYDPNHIFSEVRKARAEIQRRKKEVVEFTWRIDWSYRFLTHDLLGNSNINIPFSVRGRQRKPDEKVTTYAEAAASAHQYVLETIASQRMRIARREEVLQEYAEMIGKDVDERRTLVDVLSRYAEALHDSQQQAEVTEQVKAALKDVERFFETCCVDEDEDAEDE